MSPHLSNFLRTVRIETVRSHSQGEGEVVEGGTVEESFICLSENHSNILFADFSSGMMKDWT